MPNLNLATPEPSSPAPLQPIAAVLAWVLPGAGHFYLGHVRRALMIFAGIFGLFAGGLFIGGIDCIDRKEDFFWFLGQSLTGPVALGADYVHQNHFKAVSDQSIRNLRSTEHFLEDLDRVYRGSMTSAKAGEKRVIKDIKFTDPVTKKVTVVRLPVFEPAGPGEYPPNIKGLGRVNELGTLFCTVAGFMNLICILDASQLHRRRRVT